MSQRISFREITARLQENDLRYAVLELQHGVTLLVSEYGGRVFGPFLEPEGESLYWVNPAFRDPQAFFRLIATGWNLGGERWWVAPEIQYLCRDRWDYWNAEYIQRALDPGAWRLEAQGTAHCRLAQEMTLEVFNLATGTKTLRMETEIRPVPDPLHQLSEYPSLSAGVQYAGYEQTVTLSEAQHDQILSAAWNIIPVVPPGQMIIPASPHVEVTDYLQPVDQAHQTLEGNCVRLRITGDHLYLTGYKAAHVTGRLGYVSRLDDGRTVLIVRGFYSDPSSFYLDEPPEQPGHRGDAVRVYNDDGSYGGFGEMEVYGRAIGGETGRSTSTDSMTLWIYVGEPAQLERIARHLLGVGWISQEEQHR